MSFDKNTLLMKQHDLMQSRADCLEKATKAYESGNMTDYDTHFAEVGKYNAELDKLAGLIAECDKEFTASQADRLKSDCDRDNHVTGLLMDQIRSTEKYAKAWIESIRKGLNPGTFRSDDVFAPLYEAERASKALTIGGGTTTGEDGGFLVPIDFETKVNALLKEYVDLSTLVTVERVNVNAGWRVFDASGTRTKLSKISEMGQLPKDQQPKFKQVPYTCEKYGDKIIVSNELLADADGLMTYLAGWFAPKFVLTKNDLILEQLKAQTFAPLSGSTDAAQIKALKTLINTGLNTAHAKRATILTNSFGFDTMDNWADSTGRPMLVPDPKGGDFSRFKGKPVVYADADLIPAVEHSSNNYNPIYIGDFKSFSHMFVRQGIRVKGTDIGGDAWDTDSYEIRATCRMDCVTTDAAAVKATGIKTVE